MEFFVVAMHSSDSFFWIWQPSYLVHSCLIAVESKKRIIWGFWSTYT